MSWGSTVGAAIAALVTAAQAALPDVLVIDGPMVSSADAVASVVIGYETETAPAVEFVIANADMRTVGQQEQYTVYGCIEARSGDSLIATARATALSMFAALGAAISSDQTLDGAVMTARIAQGDLRQGQTPRAAVAQLMFGVECTAFTTR